MVWAYPCLLRRAVQFHPSEGLVHSEWSHSLPMGEAFTLRMHHFVSRTVTQNPSHIPSTPLLLSIKPVLSRTSPRSLGIVLPSDKQASLLQSSTSPSPLNRNSDAVTLHYLRRWYSLHLLFLRGSSYPSRNQLPQKHHRCHCSHRFYHATSRFCSCKPAQSCSCWHEYPRAHTGAIYSWGRLGLLFP